MTKNLFSGLLLFIFSMANSQVGIGTSSPNRSSILDLESSNKGLLPPRINLSGATDILTIPSPATGLIVYHTGNVDFESGYYYFNGTEWSKFVVISSSSGSSIRKQRLITASPTVELSTSTNTFSFRYNGTAAGATWQIRYNGSLTRPISVFTIENWVTTGYSAQAATATLNSGAWVTIPASSNVGTVNELNVYRIYDLTDGTIFKFEGILVSSTGTKESMIVEEF